MRLILPAQIRPVTLARVKEHLGLEPEFIIHNGYLSTLIASAVSYVEMYCARAVNTQTWQEVFTSWRDVTVWRIPYGMLQSVDQVMYKTEAGIETVLDATDYIVSGVGTDGGRITFNENVTLSSDLYQVEPIRVRFTCGFYTGKQREFEAAYVLGDYVQADHGLIAECTTAGDTGAAAPIWPATTGDTLADGTVEWTIVGQAVPELMQMAILIILTQQYENRELNLEVNTDRAIQSLLMPYKVYE